MKLIYLVTFLLLSGICGLTPCVSSQNDYEEMPDGPYSAVSEEDSGNADAEILMNTTSEDPNDDLTSTTEEEEPTTENTETDPTSEDPEPTSDAPETSSETPSTVTESPATTSDTTETTSLSETTDDPSSPTAEDTPTSLASSYTSIRSTFPTSSTSLSSSSTETLPILPPVDFETAFPTFAIVAISILVSFAAIFTGLYFLRKYCIKKRKADQRRLLRGSISSEGFFYGGDATTGYSDRIHDQI